MSFAWQGAPEQMTLVRVPFAETLRMLWVAVGAPIATAKSSVLVVCRPIAMFSVWVAVSMFVSVT